MEFWNNLKPSPKLPAGQVVGLLMAALQKNDHPAVNDGLRTVSVLRCTLEGYTVYLVFARRWPGPACSYEKATRGGVAWGFAGVGRMHVVFGSSSCITWSNHTLL